VGVPEEIDHLGPDAGPAPMEGAGSRSVATRPAQDAVPFLDELLDRFKQLVEVEFRSRTGKPESPASALARLDETRLSELPEQLGQVVRRSPYPLGDVSRVRIVSSWKRG
jgi:hypothetical protein